MVPSQSGSLLPLSVLPATIVFLMRKVPLVMVIRPLVVVCTSPPPVTIRTDASNFGRLPRENLAPHFVIHPEAARIFTSVSARTRAISVPLYPFLQKSLHRLRQPLGTFHQFGRFVQTKGQPQSVLPAPIQTKLVAGDEAHFLRFGGGE